MGSRPSKPACPNLGGFGEELKGFPCGSEVKASAWNAGDPGLILGLGRFPGGQIIAQDDTGHK